MALSPENHPPPFASGAGTLASEPTPHRDSRRRHFHRHAPAAAALGAVLLLAALLGAEARGRETGPDPTPASEARAAPPSGAARPVRTSSRLGTTRRSRSDPLAPPGDLHDLSAWLDYKAIGRHPALPQEARLFYRRGLMVRESGRLDEAVQLVRGAAELDPTFVAPHLTLASWLALREPGQAVAQLASLIELVRRSFALQLALVANALYLVLQTWFLAILAAGILLVALRHEELRHGWHERLSRTLAPGYARLLSWVFLVLPYTLGLGLALPTVAFLAFLWPMLRAAERALLVALVATLVAVPWITVEMDRHAAPLQDREPFYGVMALENEPYSPAQQERLAALGRAHPENPFVQFGLAWAARLGGDLSTAEGAYRRALELWPGDDRVTNNLGNVLTLEGRHDEALEYYQRAITDNPSNAAAYLNLSQAQTRRYDFRAASEALSHASALDFDLLRSFQGEATDRGLLPLADQWLSPRHFWSALMQYQPPPAARPALPPAWRGRVECSGWPFSLAVLGSALAGVLLGMLMHRGLPLRHCAHCGRVVCRRCAERRRAEAFCRSCAGDTGGIRAPELARTLLVARRPRVRRTGRWIRTAFATLIPGFGLLAFRKIWGAVFLLGVAAAFASAALNVAAPFAYEPRLCLPDQVPPPLAMVAPWLAIYAVSILGYVVESARAEAQVVASFRSARGRGSLSRRAAA